MAHLLFPHITQLPLENTVASWVCLFWWVFCLVLLFKVLLSVLFLKHPSENIATRANLGCWKWHIETICNGNQDLYWMKSNFPYNENFQFFRNFQRSLNTHFTSFLSERSQFQPQSSPKVHAFRKTPLFPFRNKKQWDREDRQILKPS